MDEETTDEGGATAGAGATDAAELLDFWDDVPLYEDTSDTVDPSVGTDTPVDPPATAPVDPPADRRAPAARPSGQATGGRSLPSQPAAPAAEPAAAAAPAAEPLNWDELLGVGDIRSDRRRRAARTKAISKLESFGIDYDRWAGLLDKVNAGEKKAQPYESAQYLMEKGAAGGRPPPAIVTQRPSTTDVYVFGAEDKDLLAVHIDSLTGEGKSFKDINDLIAKGAGDYFLGKEWTDWYLNEIQKTGLQGWLTIEQEKAFGLVPSEVPTVGVLEKGHQYTPISQLMEQGHVRSYSMLGQRGVVDLDAVRTKDATMKVLRAAKLMEKRGVDPETIEQFKYASGVGPREEANFKALVKIEKKRLFKESEETPGLILPIGARGRIAELSEAIASAEKALTAAKAKPDTASNRAAVAKAQQKLDNAKKAYEAKVQIFQESPDVGGIYQDYQKEMGFLARGAGSAQARIGPVSGATVRLDKRPGLAQGTVGGTDAAAVEDLEQLAAYVVHQKTRVAEAFHRKTQLDRQAKALKQTGYTGAQLDAAISYADSNFPAVEDEWKGIVPDLRSDWNRKEGVVIPERARQREVELEKEKNKWYKSKGYSFSVSEGRYLLTEDARLADAQADTFRRIANEQEAATEDIKRYKEGLQAMGVSAEYYGGVK